MKIAGGTDYQPDLSGGLMSDEEVAEARLKERIRKTVLRPAGEEWKKRMKENLDRMKGPSNAGR